MKRARNPNIAYKAEQAVGLKLNDAPPPEPSKPFYVPADGWVMPYGLPPLKRSKRAQFKKFYRITEWHEPPEDDEDRGYKAARVIVIYRVYKDGHKEVEIKR